MLLISISITPITICGRRKLKGFRGYQENCEAVEMYVFYIHFCLLSFIQNNLLLIAFTTYRKRLLVRSKSYKGIQVWV